MDRPKTRSSGTGLLAGIAGAAVVCLCLAGCTKPTWNDWAQNGPVLSPEYRSAPVISAGTAEETANGPDQVAAPQQH